MDIENENCITAKQVPIQSPNDKRQYRVIKLQNGLTALLISDNNPSVDQMNCAGNSCKVGSGTDSGHASGGEDDEEGDTSDDSEESDEEDVESSDETDGAVQMHKEKMAAAALCIGVGSFSDPIELPGLAHFLEHMVFMGSEKYPEENSFDAFINKHGGSDNAATDCERTVFTMEVNPKYLHEALEMFAQCFTSPLLRESSMDREVEAVDSEFQLNVPLDSCRKQQLFGSFAKENHPMSKFMWGNSMTLKVNPKEKDINVNSCLKDFWKRYYSAHYMSLALQSVDSLDTLESWVMEIFSSIPMNGFPPPSFNTMMEPFNTEKFFKLYKVVPVKKVHQVIISWALPSLQNHYKAKPVQYIGWLVGHEGKGSILSYFRRRVWALNLFAGNDESGFEYNSTYTLFSVTVVLTEKGMDNIFAVITTIFQYLEMLRREGPQERIFKEIQAIEYNKFRFQEQIESVEYVENLSENMQQYPVEHFLTGEHLFFEYDEKIIKECQDALIPSKANIIIMSSEYQKDDNFTEREFWTQTPFVCSDVPSNWLEKWNELPLNSELYLPYVNRFIATNFDLKESDIPEIEYPIKILEDDQSRLWYKKDNKFLCPKACIYFHLISPVCRSSLENATMVDLFVSLLYQLLNEDAYAAFVAGIAYSIFGDDTGLVIQVHGFNDKLPLLFDTILDHISKFEVEEDMFESLKKHLLKVYYNCFVKPGKLCKDIRLSIVQEVHWSAVEKRSALSSITREKLHSFVQQFSAALFIEGLVQGNITSKEAIELDQLVREKLKPSPLPTELIPKLCAMKLPDGQNLCRVFTFNTEDQNSVIINYYQSNLGDIKTFCLMDLLMMFMSEPCFDTLRTREQLGYDVGCKCHNTHGVVGFTVTVFSPANKYSCSFVDERIETFLEDFGEKMASVNEEEFHTQVTSLIKIKSCVDLHLKEEVDRNWSEIIAYNYLFNRLYQEVQCLEKMKLGDLQEFCRTHICGKGKTNGIWKKLGVQVVGAGKVAVQDCQPNLPDLFICSSPDKISPNIGMFAPFEHSPYTIHYNVGNYAGVPQGGDTEDDRTVYTLRILNPADEESSKSFIQDIHSFKKSLTSYPVWKVIS